jgi:hypothetical protein
MTQRVRPPDMDILGETAPSKPLLRGVSHELAAGARSSGGSSSRRAPLRPPLRPLLAGLQCLAFPQGVAGGSLRHVVAAAFLAAPASVTCGESAPVE